MVEVLGWKQRIIVFSMAIGLFALLATYCYYSYTKDEVYYIRFKSSVSGLKEGSVVTYKGVDVGSVKSIKIALPEADVIEVAIRIRKNFPIYSNYQASLVLKGFAGYSVLDLRKNNSLKMNAIQLKPGEEIEAIPSDFENLYESACSSIKQFNELLKNINATLDQNSLNLMKESLQKSAKSMSKFSKNMLRISNTIKFRSGLAFNQLADNLNLIKSIIVKMFEDYNSFKNKTSPTLSNIIELLDVLQLKVKSGANKKVGIWRWLV